MCKNSNSEDSGFSGGFVPPPWAACGARCGLRPGPVLRGRIALPCPPLLLSLLDWGQDRTSDLQEQVQLVLVLAGYSKAKAPSISPFYSWED